MNTNIKRLVCWYRNKVASLRKQHCIMFCFSKAYDKKRLPAQNESFFAAAHSEIFAILLTPILPPRLQLPCLLGWHIARGQNGNL